MINQTLRDKLSDAYMAAIPIVTLNFFWFICSLPIVTIIPATAALFYATNRLAHGKPADWHTFYEGLRLYFRRSWLWGLLNVVVIAVLVSNFVYYGHIDAQWASVAGALIIVFSVIWLSLQIYTFPLLIEQEHPHLRLALRNSVVLLIRRPFFTLGAVVLILVLAIFSTVVIFPAWFFVTASVCTYLANLATLNSIAKVNGTKPTTEPEPSEFPLEGSE